MHRLLKPSGSLFVHLDWRMAHYVKIELDKIFGVKNPSSNTNFINEIIWWYGGGGASKNRFAKKHDTILWYAKDKSKYKFFCDSVREPYKWDKGQKRADGSKRDYTKGKIPDDVFQMNSIMPWSNEKIGWPTQKPIKLLQRIIKATTQEDDLVADFFCGCGTSIDASQSLNRKWLGVDAGITACQVMQKRMEDRHSLFVGIDTNPMTLKDFKVLKPLDFEEEAVRYIGGVPNIIKVGEGGIDGRLAFDGTPIQVKKFDKKIGDNDMFRGFYMHLKEHGRGVYITLNGYTNKAKERASSWRREGLDIQLLSIPDMLKGKFREQPLPKKVA